MNLWFRLVLTRSVFGDGARVSGSARERLHWSFPDPSRTAGGREERLRAFRDVRDEIRARIEGKLAKSGV